MKFNEFNNGDTNTMKTMTSKEKKQAFLDACKINLTLIQTTIS